jgi:hypothetical protein
MKAPPANTIQRAWRRQFRHRLTRQLVERLMRDGPTPEYVKSINFDSLVVHLREKPVIAAAKACLQRLHLLTTFRHGSPPRALAPENVNVRVFLAGYMIAYRPTHVFETIGPLEQALLEAATPLLTTFDSICKVVRQKGSFQAVPSSLTQAFPTLLFEFLKRFKAWKGPDEIKLTLRIKHALLALYQAEAHLPPDEPVDSKLKLEFRTQIDRLRGKLRQIAGAPAVDEFDAQRLSGALVFSSCVGGNASSNPNEDPDGNGAYMPLPGRMTNEQLAHELLLEPTFQLDEDGGFHLQNPIFRRIRETFHQAFWDSLVDDLRLATPCYVRVLRVLAEIRDGVKDIATQWSTGAAAIDEAVDLDFIKAQAEAGRYTWTNCRNLIEAVVVVIQRVQAAKRDEETRTLWAALAERMEHAAPAEQPRAFCAAIEFLLGRVNAMRIDAANTKLRLIAPVIKDHGVEYERGKFQDKLNDGVLTLERTTNWVRDTLRAELAAERLSLDDLLSGRPVDYLRVHYAGMVRLVTESDHPVVPADCPETLSFDVHRITQMRRDFTALARKMAVIQVVPPGERRAAVAEAVADEDGAAQRLEGVVAPHLTVEAHRQLVHQVLQPQHADPIHRLMVVRLRAYLEGALVRAPRHAAFVATFTTLAPRIQALVEGVRKLSNFNRVVHMPTYNRLIEQESLALHRGDAMAH